MSFKTPVKVRIVMVDNRRIEDAFTPEEWGALGTWPKKVELVGADGIKIITQNAKPDYRGVRATAVTVVNKMLAFATALNRDQYHDELVEALRDFSSLTKEEAEKRPMFWLGKIIAESKDLIAKIDEVDNDG